MSRLVWLASVAIVYPYSQAPAQQAPAPPAVDHSQHQGHQQPQVSPPPVPAQPQGHQQHVAPVRPAPAAKAPPAATMNAGHEHGGHHHHATEIVVTGFRRNEGEMLGGFSVVEGPELARELRTSLGETLARQPGVSATSFGPTASRPILRGFSGDRIRVLTDGIGTFDLASASADHGTAINPLTAERIEVLRGPSALLFGSYAIGGVVNVLDARIPRRAPPGRGLVHSIFTYGTAADDRSLHTMGDASIGGGIVGHLDANWMRSGNLRTGGYLLSEQLRREAAASSSPEIRELAKLKGELPNTSSRSTELTGSLAYVNGGLNVGASVTRHESRYGVPIRFSLDPAVEAEAPTLDMRQTRGDARAEVPLDGFLEVVRLRAGIAKYRHDEIEETGEVASSLFSNGGEARLELAQAERDGWSGTSGAQYLARSVRIEGAEQYIPDSRHKQLGLFTMQALDRGPLRLEGGARIEHTRVRPEEAIGTTLRARDFTTFSASLAAGYEFSSGWRAGITVSRAARAPSIDELFANGPHAATQSFEVGNPHIDAERSRSFELSLRRTAGPVRLKATAYYTAFSNYIFQSPTGEAADGYPVFAYAQAPADYYGAELEAEAKLGRALGIDWSGELMGDAIRATIKDFGPSPLIPPARLLGALSGAAGQIDGRIEVEHGFAQRRNAPLETETPAYTLVNASIEWHPLPDKPLLTVTLMGNNLLDSTVRRHSSLLKDYAPLAGRELRLSARLSF